MTEGEGGNVKKWIYRGKTKESGNIEAWGGKSYDEKKKKEMMAERKVMWVGGNAWGGKGCEGKRKKDNGVVMPGVVGTAEGGKRNILWKGVCCGGKERTEKDEEERKILCKGGDVWAEDASRGRRDDGIKDTMEGKICSRRWMLWR